MGAPGRSGGLACFFGQRSNRLPSASQLPIGQIRAPVGAAPSRGTEGVDLKSKSPIIALTSGRLK
jgi:hypothetical protein